MLTGDRLNLGQPDASVTEIAGGQMARSSWIFREKVACFEAHDDDDDHDGEDD